MHGKAICHGVALEELEASSLLDVLHFFFEEDVISVTSAEQAESREKTRSLIYSSLYQKTYKYVSGGKASSTRSFIDDELSHETGSFEDEIPTPLDPSAMSARQPGAMTKPYVPPTRINSNSRLPFGSTLDGPLG